jgi:CheY-like chemotaxis protein
MKVVLLIEDNNENRENTCEMLELEGYEVIFAANGRKGIDLAKEKIPDIILCDILMPEMDGYQVFRGVKNDIKTAHIPFIFLTASGEKKEIALGIAMGARGYIRKPFEAHELFGTIANCLNADDFIL